MSPVKAVFTGVAFAFGLVLALTACGSSKAQPDTFSSSCGHPGDQGNELGVGKFCQMISDCNTTPNASICSNLGDVTTFFCTRTCQGDAGNDQCGTGAQTENPRAVQRG